MRNFRHGLPCADGLLGNLSPGEQSHPPALPDIGRISLRGRNAPKLSGWLHDLGPGQWSAGFLDRMSKNNSRNTSIFGLRLRKRADLSDETTNWSRMREIRQSGSEGGARLIPRSYSN